MNKDRLATVMALALLLAVSARSEEGFVPLFNGKDLSGWDGDPALWSVQDGAICGETTAGHPARKNTFLIWRGGVLTNFELRVTFRLRNGNSGIQYRSREIGPWRVAGYQAEVENTPGKVGFLYDEAARGWMVDVGDSVLWDREGKKQPMGKVADVDALKREGYYKNGDWNEYVILARGNHLAHYLNGRPTMELIDEDPKGRALQGLLALQIHAGAPMRVEFKNILLRTLDAPYGDAIRLFNGRTLEGWTPSAPPLAQAWSVRDGALANEGKPTGYLRTTANYTSFLLRLQFRHLTPGNSGVLLRMQEPDKVWPRSIEAQGKFGDVGDIFNIDAFPMKADPARTVGRRTPKRNPSNEKEPGAWNEYEIEMDGGDLSIRVNRLLQNQAGGCADWPGKIGLQSEGARMEYRHMVLIPILKKGPVPSPPGPGVSAPKP